MHELKVLHLATQRKFWKPNVKAHLVTHKKHTWKPNIRTLLMSRDSVNKSVFMMFCCLFVLFVFCFVVLLQLLGL